jgi:hypothetical protein
MVNYMQILIELDEDTHRRLEKVAPARSRKRSAFIRAAIRKSLWELEEEKTRQAYLDTADNEPAPLDATVWEPLPYGGFDAPRSTRAGQRPAKRGRSSIGKASKSRTRRTARTGKRRA